jgi:hypothetical protein
MAWEDSPLRPRAPIASSLTPMDVDPVVSVDFTREETGLGAMPPPLIVVDAVDDAMQVDRLDVDGGSRATPVSQLAPIRMIRR